MNNGAEEQPALLSCTAAASALYDFLDGRLADTTERAVEQHIQTCKTCARHFEFSRRALAQLAASAPLDGDAGELRRRIVDRLRAEGYAGAG